MDECSHVCMKRIPNGQPKRRMVHMQASDIYRWSGITGILAGGLNLIVELLPEQLSPALDLFVNILGLGVLTALYVRQRAASGVTGWIGYVTQFFGMAVVIGFLFTQAFVLGSLDAAQRAALLTGPAGIVTVIGLAITAAGAILFGIASLQAGLFPRWAAFLLMLGFVIVPIGAAVSPLLKTAGEVILSAGLIGLSYSLFSGAREAS
jgi:hypothetical protein